MIVMKTIEDPCHDGGREHRPGEEVESDDGEDEDAEDEENEEDDNDENEEDEEDENEGVENDDDEDDWDETIEDPCHGDDGVDDGKGYWPGDEAGTRKTMKLNIKECCII